jgi:hypothetical protein
VTFSFGHSVGAGIAEYDATHSLDAAIWQAFLAWNMDLLEIETKGTYADGTGKPTGKSFAAAIWAIEKYAIYLEEELSYLLDYEMVKVEATVAVDFEDGHFYSGHLDELLFNSSTGKYLVKENKTTGMRSVDPVNYANSDQALSYAVVIDSLGATEYQVLYTVYSSSAQEWMSFMFTKTALKKASWLQDQLLIHQQLDNYAELDFFPMRGSACFDFMRRCPFFERCEVNPSTTYGIKFADMAKVLGREQLDTIENVDYYVTLSEIVNRQKENLNETI